MTLNKETKLDQNDFVISILRTRTIFDMLMPLLKFIGNMLVDQDVNKHIYKTNQDLEYRLTTNKFETKFVYQNDSNCVIFFFRLEFTEISLEWLCGTNEISWIKIFKSFCSKFDSISLTQQSLKFHLPLYVTLNTKSKPSSFQFE